jgi:hypothetical protein
MHRICMVVCYVMHRRNSGFTQHSVLLGPSLEQVPTPEIFRSLVRSRSISVCRRKK